MKRAFAALLVVVVGMVTTWAQAPTAPDMLLKRAQQREQVDGDLAGAVALYRQIVESHADDRGTASEALLRLARIYERQGQSELARVTWTRVVEGYPTTAAAVTARAVLASRDVVTAPLEPSLRRLWSTNADRTGYTLGAVSRDGRFLTYVAPAQSSIGSALRLRDLQTGAERPLTTETPGEMVYQSVISPDGARVAFLACTSVGCELRVAGLDGTGVPQARSLVAGDDIFDVQPLDWSRDGEWIAVKLRRRDRTAHVALVSPRDGAVRLIKPTTFQGPSKIAFSPAARALAFDATDGSTNEPDLVVVNLDDTTEVGGLAHPGSDRVVGWTPDGGHLLFVSDRTGAMGLWTHEFAGSVLRGPARLLMPNIGDVRPLGIMPDGTMFLGMARSDADVEIMGIDLDRGTSTGTPRRPIQRFVGVNHQPAWSPDGRYLAYASRRGADAIVVVQSVDGSEVRELLPTPRLSNSYEFRGLTWAPDGQSFVVGGSELSGREGIYRIDARSGVTTPLVAPIAVGDRPAFGGFHWSPDAKRLYFSRLNGEVVERDLAAGQERIIVAGTPVGTTAAPRAGLIHNISLSPDGRWIAAVLSLTATGPADAVALISVETGEAKELVRVNRPASIANEPPAWTRDGRSVLLRRRTSADAQSVELWLQPTDGSAPRKLNIDVRRAEPAVKGSLRLSPDGGQLAYGTLERSMEVWVVTGLSSVIARRR